MASVDLASIDPVTVVPFQISKQDKIATAGSCFAQHISRILIHQGYQYLVTEHAPVEGGENYGVYPARFGNIYTARQLLQTFDRAYGLFYPKEHIWKRSDGAYVDAFRPRIQTNGFASESEMIDDRRQHFFAIRDMFETCDVFVFTLGLTEGWISKIDGAVFPLAPGVAGGEFNEDRHAFENFTPETIVADLRLFLDRLRTVNPFVRVILTVSPVPLVATYEDRHVLLSNTFSKAALRVAAEMVSRSDPSIFYFPSLEIITNARAGATYFADDLRSITDEGVSRVMSVFSKHLLTDFPLDRSEVSHKSKSSVAPNQDRLREYSEVICDEEDLDAD